MPPTGSCHSIFPEWFLTRNISVKKLLFQAGRPRFEKIKKYREVQALPHLIFFDRFEHSGGK